MDNLEKYGNIIEGILQQYAALPYRYGDVNTFVIVSQDRKHFLLMDEGWQDDLRVYGVITHVELRQDKIWIQRDGIEDGITSELLEAGISKDKIVLGFQSPEIRQYTEFAIN
ncbi:XisI protein [Gloeothece citriformis PCC 7424]|uniref:XisI protein n=1 Tax=Gloeothece citriformis (strain PCC 7424) TaxID=65393 RepID=B7KJH6_GLOC7|nr:XisI protein [Gloeothece citriformis]ACK73653.1 XisI protein [Gloeothece citriformis PCC 7424]